MLCAVLGAVASLGSVAAVDIDVGRQLFVDDWVIAGKRGIVRHWNSPTKVEDPVVWPGAGAAPRGADGSSFGPTNGTANLTCATDGGVWWDPTRRKYRLWYQADWLGDICYAESDDGIRWQYPDCGVVKGTNRLFEYDVIDSWCVMPNYFAENPYADWKLFVSEPGTATRLMTPDRLWRSTDGIRFEALGQAGESGDRSVAYCDPFRRQWVFSLRDYRKGLGRCRRYFAAPTFGGERCRWRAPAADGTDDARPVAEEWLVATNRPNWQLYSFTAVAYESLMLGVMEVLYNMRGDNGACEKVGLPKQTALHFCFSRNGRDFTRPRNSADLAPSGWGSGKWDTGYLSPVGGVCTVSDERLRFYYSALRGDGTKRATEPHWARNGMYANGAIGCATLRRDGFAGLVADGRGSVVTRPLKFSGAHLFVNAECRFGSLTAEVLDRGGMAIPGFSAADCAGLRQTNALKRELVFRGGTLKALGGDDVSIRFILTNATLYSFWISPSARGESRGYVAGGGPDYPGLRDLR